MNKIAYVYSITEVKRDVLYDALEVSFPPTF